MDQNLVLLLGRLKELLEKQVILWKLVKPDLDEDDRKNFKVPFMELHDPIGQLRKALSLVEEAMLVR